jgi:GT2 family glycosyltransferase
VVVDDASPPEHQMALRSLPGVVLELAAENGGFAASVNRGARHAGEADDIVVLNNDVIAHRRWLERLQWAAYREERIGVAGPKLLYPDGRIQSAGTSRNLGALEWFDHRYRFKPGHHGPANVRDAVLATTGACLYLKRPLWDQLGGLDDGFGMGYEDVDYCLRAWEAGFEVLYYPHASLTHLEAKTRGMEQGEREIDSQRRFWDRWGHWFDERPVRADDGRLRIVYVTEDTGVGGGHVYMPWWLDNRKLDFPRGYHIEFGGGMGMPGYGFGFGMQNMNGKYPGRDGNMKEAGGYGASLKDDYRYFYGATFGMAGRGEAIAREDNYCEIDPNTVDKFGIPVLRFHYKWSDYEIKQAKHM